jgi:Fe-S-cluster-containing dehydrogenase component
VNRRNFLKLASAGGALLASGTGTSYAAAENQPPIPGAVAMLYDSTLCVGCQACVAECQRVNESALSPKAQTWSANDKLSPYTNNIIQVWSSGDGKNKDQTDNGYAYIKKQCMHCVDPNCVSVCPVQALKKDPKTGVVHYDPDVCTGCRYCMVGCPFSVPKYDYDNPFGKIHKCEFCNQKGLERLDKGLLPGCVEALKRNDPYRHQVPHYQPMVYGEKEGGGTQVLVLTGVPFGNLGLPALDELSTGERSEHIQHTIYKGMILPFAGLVGLSLIIHRNHKKHPEDSSHE